MTGKNSALENALIGQIVDFSGLVILLVNTGAGCKPGKNSALENALIRGRGGTGRDERNGPIH